jgi:hypothetical protein
MSWRRKGDAVDIADWLRGLDLEKYAPAFDENAINWDVLSELTTDDLKDIDVAAGGDRRRLLAAIAALRLFPPPHAGEGRVGVEAERRHLTVMFCDLVGSTPLSTRFDPEDLREIVGAYHRCVTDTVGRFAGFVAKYMGDGVLVHFGYPEGKGPTRNECANIRRSFHSSFPRKRTVIKFKNLVIPGRGRSPRARKPGTQAYKNIGEDRVHSFRARPFGPSRNDRFSPSTFYGLESANALTSRAPFRANH